MSPIADVQIRRGDRLAQGIVLPGAAGRAGQEVETKSAKVTRRRIWGAPAVNVAD